MYSKRTSFLFLIRIFSILNSNFYILNSDSYSEGAGFKIYFDFIEQNQTNESLSVEQQDYNLLQYCKLSNDTLNKPNGKYFQS